jgi:hypothetical protein
VQRAGMWLRAGLGAVVVVSASGAAQAETPLKVLAAIYGTPATHHTCDATAVIARGCDGRTSCDVLAGNWLCGDPDYEVPKTLNIVFTCGPAEAHSVTAAEASLAHLSCGAD